MGEFWTRKYAPKSTAQIIGQDSGINLLKNFVNNFPRKKACLLYGPPGCGKTSSAIAIATELGLELVELNASDFRNAAGINSIVGAASKQMSLLFKGKIILVDEIDGIAGRQDRGGVQALIKLLSESAFPIIVTANDPFASKFSKLRKSCQMIQFEELKYDTVVKVLREICTKEGITFDKEGLEGLARRADGDVRGAIIDLFILTRIDNKLSKDELEILSDRRHVVGLIDGITRILKTKEVAIALSALNNVSENIDEVLLWIDENMPKEYKKAEDLARAYEALSKAAVFKGRIRRRQHWRFLVYVNALLTVGISLAKDEKYNHVVKYDKPSRILKIWIYNRKNLIRKGIAEKLASVTHSSKKYAFKETVPYIQVIYRNNEKFRQELNESLELDDKEIEWLKGSPE